MSCSFGNFIRVTVFGQAHADAVGVVIDGIPAGFSIDFEAVQAFLNRRAPGKDPLASARRESDVPEILSGISDGRTNGAPVTAIFKNQDKRSADYRVFKEVPRPMHADFPAFIKYHGCNDIRGGGQFSGRMTAPLCFAGAISLQFLQKIGISIGAHIASVSSIKDAEFHPTVLSEKEIHAPAHKDFPVIDDAAGVQMRAQIERARQVGDSLGGIVECAAIGVPIGIGEPIYDSIESRIASLLFSIPAVKGVEFGAGFASAVMRGSEHNDAYTVKNGTIVTETNRHGGILGGISTGMPILLRAAFKPTPSIAMEQRSVNLQQMTETTLAIKGRHDPCIVPRAVPCVEAAAALALLDLAIEWKGRQLWN